MKKLHILLALLLMTSCSLEGDKSSREREHPRIVPVAKGWAKNSVNATIFRVNSVTTHSDIQYVAFYSEDTHVVLAKRKLGTTSWQIRKTQYKGDTRDAHNGISIAVDGTGILHMSWDHHCDPLRYCRGAAPGSLELTDEMPMTGQNEKKVTYPEFYNLPNGDLLFLYRDGGSGRGNTMLNRYDVRTQKWSAIQHPLIDGQGERNAYTNQIAVDKYGTWHISWCWRETGDVATNHDICYAKSTDKGRTWRKSTGEKYTLPITAQNAEYARRIPQKSELINQTSMTVDSKGRSLIATYWRPEGTKVPQYHLIYHDGRNWRTVQVGSRMTPFSLSGPGTKYLLMSRPKILAADGDRLCMIFRDAERGNRVSAGVCEDAGRVNWRIEDLTDYSVGEWEPSYDPILWQRENVLHLFVQKVEQKDLDVLDETPAQMASVLEWTPP
ncbi:MAG: BNR repeat-containing protein [Planctomycetota bacterium]